VNQSSALHTTFLAAAVEAIEMVIIGVGTARGWRAIWVGAAANSFRDGRDRASGDLAAADCGSGRVVVTAGGCDDRDPARAFAAPAGYR
jgi:hypothetical protein